MKGVPQVVNTLKGLLAGELRAGDQYLAHGEIYSDQGLVWLAEHTLHESDHEREHARAIIQRILFLDGEPDVASRLPMTLGKSVEEMLKNDLQIEYQVAGHLKKAVEICEVNQDFVSRDMLVQQIEDTEMDHAYFLEKQIKLIELVGIENYLQSQLGPEPEVQ